MAVEKGFIGTSKLSDFDIFIVIPWRAKIEPLENF
jgi:hypothetical protein